jgi:hypothetical protein
MATHISTRKAVVDAFGPEDYDRSDADPYYVDVPAPDQPSYLELYYRVRELEARLAMKPS